MNSALSVFNHYSSQRYKHCLFVVVFFNKNLWIIKYFILFFLKLFFFRMCFYKVSVWEVMWCLWWKVMLRITSNWMVTMTRTSWLSTMESAVLSVLLDLLWPLSLAAMFSHLHHSTPPSSPPLWVQAVQLTPLIWLSRCQAQLQLLDPVLQPRPGEAPT